MDPIMDLVSTCSDGSTNACRWFTPDYVCGAAADGTLRTYLNPSWYTLSLSLLACTLVCTLAPLFEPACLLACLPACLCVLLPALLPLPLSLLAWHW